VTLVRQWETVPDNELEAMYFKFDLIEKDFPLYYITTKALSKIILILFTGKSRVKILFILYIMYL